MPKTMSKKQTHDASKRRHHAPEFRAQVVRLVTEEGKTPYAVAKELGLAQASVARWVQQAEVDAGRGSAGALTSAEREEFNKLRREVKMLRQERDILRKATALFAKEGMS